MQWPDKPTCHTRPETSPFKTLPMEWREPETDPNGRPYRTCSYCGSIHPEDLAIYLEAGGRPSQADWKYGYPHKFYINDVPNPQAGMDCEVGWHNTERGREVVMGKAPATLFVKWYTDHLLDEGYDDEARDRLLKALEPSGVKFFFDQGELKYIATTQGG